MKTMDEFREEIGCSSFVSVRGGGTRWDLGGALLEETLLVEAPSGVIEYKPEEMIVRVGAGTKLTALQDGLTELKQEVALAGLANSTVGGSLAVGSSSHSMARIGRACDVLLQADCVGADGKQFVAGGPTVKNVTGYDICRLLVSSLGTLALMGVVTLRTRPKPEMGVWMEGQLSLKEIVSHCYRPASVLYDGSKILVFIEGYEKDVEKEKSSLEKAGMTVLDGSIEVPPQQKGTFGKDLKDGFMELQTGVVYSNDCKRSAPVSEEVRRLSNRIKENFDPTGRLNPGRSVF